MTSASSTNSETTQGIIDRISRVIDTWFLDIADRLAERARLRYGLAFLTMALSFVIFGLGVGSIKGSNHLLSALNPGRVEEHRYLQQHIERFPAEKSVFIGTESSGQNDRGARFDFEPGQAVEYSCFIRKALRNVEIIIEIIDDDEQGGLLHGLAKWESPGKDPSIEGDYITVSATRLRRTLEVKVQISGDEERGWRLAPQEYERSRVDPLVFVEPFGSDERKRFCSQEKRSGLACCNEAQRIDSEKGPRCFVLRPFPADEGESSSPTLVPSYVTEFDEETGREWVDPNWATAYMFVEIMVDLSGRPELQEVVLAHMHRALGDVARTEDSNDVGPECSSEQHSSGPPGQIGSLDASVNHAVQASSAGDHVQNGNKTHDADIYFAGIPVVEAESATILSANRMKSFFILGLFLSALFLIFIIFNRRNWRMLLVSVCTIVGSVAFSYGFFGLVFHRDAWLTGLLPVLALALGTSAPIHILGSYHSQFGSSTQPIIVAKATIRRVFRPCFYAMITTVAGLLLLGVVDFWDTLFPPESTGNDPQFMMRDFSFSLLIGVISSLILAVWFIVLILPHPKRQVGISESAAISPRVLLSWIFSVIARHPLKIIGSFMFFSVVGIQSYRALDRGADAREFFDEDRHSSRSTVFFERYYRGTNTYEIVIEGGGPAHYREPIVDPTLLSKRYLFGHRYPEITMPEGEISWEPAKEDCFEIDRGGEVSRELCLSDPERSPHLR